MTDRCRVEEETNAHYYEMEKLEERSDEIDERAYQSHYQAVYGEPDTIWEAIGLDGAFYKKERMTLSREIERADYTNDLALQISHAIRDGDRFLLGDLVMQYAKPYLDHVVEDRVETFS